jgi:hypothetical protein
MPTHSFKKPLNQVYFMFMFAHISANSSIFELTLSAYYAIIFLELEVVLKNFGE